jgi:mono/diheme cytochrome c family protein
MPEAISGRGRTRALLGACAILLGIMASPVLAVEKDLTDRGEELVKQNCARCHAIGKEGSSPHPEAPPFRTLSGKYPVEDLAESLAEGIVSGHPDMPIFAFNAHDVEAIIQYLQSIQEQPAPPAAAPDKS